MTIKALGKRAAAHPAKVACIWLIVAWALIAVGEVACSRAA